jgi:hypothetical protein
VAAETFKEVASKLVRVADADLKTVADAVGERRSVMVPVVAIRFVIVALDEVSVVILAEPKSSEVVTGNDTACEDEMAIAVTPFVWMFKAPELSAENVIPVTLELIPESALMIEGMCYGPGFGGGYGCGATWLHA